MSTAPAGPASAAQAAAAHPSFLSRFTVLRGAPRELWIMFLVKLAGIAAYGIMNTTFVLWLSYDLGYSDQQAGFLVAGWSMAMTLFTVFVGSLTDAIGLRKAILLGLTVTVAARAVMTFSTVKWLALAGGMVPLALGEALTVPVLVAGIRRYSTTAQRSISFALFYAMMNVGFLIANYIFDHVRQTLGEPHGHWLLPWLRLDFTTYRVLFLISLLIEIAMVPIAWFALRDGRRGDRPGTSESPPNSPNTPVPAFWRPSGSQPATPSASPPESSPACGVSKVFTSSWPFSASRPSCGSSSFRCITRIPSSAFANSAKALRWAVSS